MQPYSWRRKKACIDRLKPTTSVLRAHEVAAQTVIVLLSTTACTYKSKQPIVCDIIQTRHCNSITCLTSRSAIRYGGIGFSRTYSMQVVKLEEVHVLHSNTSNLLLIRSLPRYKSPLLLQQVSGSWLPPWKCWENTDWTPGSIFLF